MAATDVAAATSQQSNRNSLPEGMSLDELACIYSVAILADDDIHVTSEKINCLLKAANVDVEQIWPTIYSRALSQINVRHFLTESVFLRASTSSRSSFSAEQNGVGSSSLVAVSSGTDQREAGKNGDDAKKDGGKNGVVDDDDEDEEGFGLDLFSF